MSEGELLVGDGVTQGIVRIGDTVRRPLRPFSLTIQAYLAHLREAGFTAAPLPLGVDEQGREVLSYVPGEVPRHPLPPETAGDDVLVALARLIRALHEASAGWVPPPDAVWGGTPANKGRPPIARAELVSHCDYCPGNVVFRDGLPVALIDFDLAHPTTRLYDLANAVWYWAPLRDPRDRAPAFADADIPHRVAVFADAYGMTAQHRAELAPFAVDMARRYHEDSRVSAELDPVFRKLWEEGAKDRLPRAEAWLRETAPAITARLTGSGTVEIDGELTGRSQLVSTRKVLGVFTRPEDLADEQIRAALRGSWSFAAEALSYLPVGFGSHHWHATNAAGRQLFLTVHDLPHMLQNRADTTEAAFSRLATAFGCALSLRRDANLEFVLAPIPTDRGEVVRRLSQRYSVAAFPYLADCEPGHAGEFPTADRPAVIRLLTALHQARPAVAPQRCDFGLQNADGLRAAIASIGEPWDTGRYGEQARVLLARHAAAVTALMAAYDELARHARSRPERFVVTHSEPGPWNVLKTPAGFVFVDWDFVQLAPPERDLWDMAEIDRSVLAAYTEATGTAIDSRALALFRMWYDLAEIAEYIELFRGAHDNTADAAESWRNLEIFLRPAERWPELGLPGS